VRADLAVQAARTANDDEIPGLPAPSRSIQGELDAVADANDVFAIQAEAGQTIRARLTSTQPGFDLRLFGPGQTTIAAKEQAGPATSFDFVVPAGGSGTHYLDVRSTSGAGSYRVDYVVGFATSVSASAPSTCAWNGSATVSGALKKTSGAAVPGAMVKVEAWPVGAGAWSVVGQGTTLSSGSYSVAVSPKKQTSYRVVFAGEGGEYLTAMSPTRKVTPKAYLTKPSAPSSIRKGRYFTSAGALRPRHTTGAKTVRIKAYRKIGGTYRYYKSYYAVNKYYSSWTTTYSKRIRLPYRGRWKLVATVEGDSLHATTSSSARYLTVY